MNHFNIWLLWLTLLFPLFLSTGGCKKGNDYIYKIGVSQCSSDEWRDKMNNEMRRELLFHENAVMEIRSANDNNQKQIEDIEYFLDNDFDIIIVAPNEAEAITGAVKKVYDSGVPIIIFDRRVRGDAYTAYIDLDNKGIGRSAAEYAHSLFGNKDTVQLIEITGLAGSTPAEERHSGFIEGLTSYPNCKLMASVSGDWDWGKARNLADSLLSLYPEIKVVYAHSDNMAIGVSHLFKEKGRDDIKILGTDASPGQGIQAIKDGIIEASFIYPTEGHRIIRTAFDILEGKPFEKTVHIPALTSVDKSNAEILQRQYELLNDETQKVILLDEKNDELLSRHKTLRESLTTVIVLAIVLVCILVLLLLVFLRNRRLQKKLADQNKSLEEERDKQKELYLQLNKATNSKLSFFTNVSHDLRTPLTLIYEPLRQLMTRPYLKPEDKSLLKVASKNAEILQRLIDDILDFQKHETGKSELKLSEVKAVNMLREWTEMFRSVANKRHMELNFITDSDESVTMALDVEKMERVFFNLLSNAFRYTPDNGKITVRCEVRPEELKFSVADTGIGIKEEDLKKIFENFFRAEDIKPKGSGIGLAVTKEFVELHDGEITVDSKHNEGSVFTVTVPVIHTDKNDVTNVATYTTNVVETLLDNIDNEEDMEFLADKPLMLAIDDNSDIRFLIKEMMKEKYNVITASDGKKGVRLAMKYVPDLIICDIMMPEMDGIECCSILKKESSTSHIPVLMLTACKLDEQRIQSYDSGADGFISKPFNGDILISRCENLIKNRNRIKDLFDNTQISPKEEKSNPVNTDSKSLENDFYSKFITIIKTQYADSSLSTESIAGKLNLGGAQLTRKIKALTNYTPVEILRNYRLDKARKLLLTTDKNINEITFAVGFSSAAYLTKCFREHFGQTPSELRAKS